MTPEAIRCGRNLGEQAERDHALLDAGAAPSLMPTIGSGLPARDP